MEISAKRCGVVNIAENTKDVRLRRKERSRKAGQ